MASKQIASDGSLIWQDDSPTTTSPLSGNGASRQARRMQLRNAGFRGPAIPGRKVTPKSLSSSTWSNMSSGQTQSSDAENQSPSGNRANLSIGKRRGSGVLTEIGNATLTRPKKHHARPRITSAKFYSSNIEGRKSGEYDAAFPMEHPSPPPPPKGAPKLRSAKVKGKLGAKRRSVSGETKKYVDHLEAELASTQSQLLAVTSPSITRQQTNMVRSLNAETKQLQDALEEWEDKYDERVQEVVEQHTAIAIGLRNQLRSHEEQGEEDRYRIHELEEQVGAMRQNLESAEVANVQLEKRLEVLSDLLATSAKIDLHAETPGRLRRMSRPKSVHLRFPTTGNLMISPDRLSESGTQPPSPAISFAGSYSNLELRQTQSHQEFVSGNVSQSEQNSDAESVFFDAPVLGDSFNSAEPSLITHHAHFDMPPPSLPPRGRPTRRMRRFGAGSIGPRPLILPSASHYDHVPASAPALEYNEQSRGFPFRDQSVGRRNGSPLMGRRRASTMMDQATLASLAGSDHLAVPGAEEADEDMPSFTSPASGISQISARDYPSIGSCTGAAISRNLMEELSQIRSNDMTDETNDFEQEDGASAQGDQEDDTELQDSFTDPLEPIPESHSREVSDTSHSTATVMGLQPCASAKPRSDLSFIARLRRIFGDLWRSPVELARHLVQRAQACMRLPAPLRNVQWWLVSMLLGPMAKRRLLSAHHNHSRNDDNDDRERLLIPEQEQSPDSPTSPSHDLAYGNFYPSSPEARASKRSRRPGMAGPGKKVVSYRSGSSSARRNTHQLIGLGRHSPWLWLKFSITLAFAIGCAFKSGPGSLLSLEEECSGCESCGSGGQRARCGTPS
ncbi:hypothetical protein Q7P35_005887 [Cladosporium inversicolor]